MKFSYSWLQSFFRTRLPRPQKLADIITNSSFEVEGVETEKKDTIFDISVLPNRVSDCASYYGMARELSAILGTPLKKNVFQISFKEDAHFETKDFAQVSVQDKKHCLRYCGKVILDITPEQSPQWMQERLSSSGIRSVNSVVDVANYVMLETGQPMHVYDLDKLIAGSKRAFKAKIVVRKAKAVEEIETLDDQKHVLTKGMPVVANEKSLLAIAGVQGGADSQVTDETKRIFLEAANFDPVSIQKTAQELGIKTESSFRFEHGVDPAQTAFAIEYATFLLHKIHSGKGQGKEHDEMKICGGMIDISQSKVAERTIILDLDYVQNLLGVALAKRDVQQILSRLHFSFQEASGHALKVSVPSWRRDVEIQEDLIEEIGRIHGYEQIPSSFPLAGLVPPKTNKAYEWERAAKNYMKEAGFLESYTYSFIGEQISHIFGYKRSKRFDLLEVDNPMSSEYQYLRPSLLPRLLECVQRNLAHDRAMKLFEIGKVFFISQLQHGTEQEKKKMHLVERRQLSYVVCGEDFYYAKGVIHSLLHSFGVSDIWYNEYIPSHEKNAKSHWNPKQCAYIKVGGRHIGTIGQINPKITEQMKINVPVIAVDIDFDALSELATAEHEFRPVSKYPSAVRDIAVLVPRTIKVGDVLNVIHTAGGSDVRDIDVFDIYEGDRIDRGMKNIAFHIMLQSSDHTLSPREIEEYMRTIIQKLEKKKWSVRRQEHV